MLRELQRRGQPLSGNERHCVFLNTGQLRFANMSATSGLDLIDDGRGLAYVDWDHDGDLDLWISNRTAPQARFLRNDASASNHYLAIRLEGRSSNRDAIGARLELYLKNNDGSDVEKRIKTLYAGHGFLAQSSKWLHFGLGQRASIDRLVVRWPVGEPESFSRLDVDRWYQIVQGSGKASPWTPPSGRTNLQPSVLEGTPPTTAGRISLAVRAPIPLLRYVDFANHPVSLNKRLEGPTLINLWASWCQPCQKELKELAAHEQALSEVGLQIVALSVDGLDDDNATDPADAISLSQRLKLPFDTRFANPDLLSKLQALHDVLFDRYIQLAVPTSFLIDGNGQVAAIYRGPVQVDQLLDDVIKLDATLEQRLVNATPFPGRWLGQPQLHMSFLADRFDKAGFLEDAVLYLREGVRRHPQVASVHTNLGLGLVNQGKPQEGVKHFGNAVRLDPNDPRSHLSLGMALQVLGKLDDAIRHYRRALELKPDYVRALNNLGHALLELGRVNDAMRRFHQALDIDPNFVNAHYNLADALTINGQLEEAVRHFKQALAIKPQFVPARFKLGQVWLELGKPDKAISNFRQVVKADPDHLQGHYHLAIILTHSGQLDNAYHHYQEAVRIQPDWPQALNGLAWLQATHPSATIRAPAQAIRRAQRAADLTDHEDAATLDTLAAAYAAALRFDRAIQTAQDALKLASAENNDELASQIRQRLELYKQDKPYRQDPETVAGG